MNRLDLTTPLRLSFAFLTPWFLAGCLASPTPQSSAPDIVSAGPQERRAEEIRLHLVPIDFRDDGAVLRSAFLGTGASDKSATSRLPTDPDDSSILGWARHASLYGQQREALRLAVAACAERPEQAETWTFLATLLRRQGDWEKSLSALRRARTELAPGENAAAKSILVETARVFDRHGSFDEAVAAWRDVLVEEPNHVVARRRLAARFFLAGDLGVARTFTESLVADGESLPPQLSNLLQPTSLRPAPRKNDIVVEPPIRIDTGGAAQAVEPHLVAGDDGVLIAGWNDLREPNDVDAWSLGVAISSDRGQTWSDELLRAPGNVGEDYEGDPMTAYDPRTGNLWIGGVTFFDNRNIYVARKAPGEDQLETPVVTQSDLVFDKGLLAVGPSPINRKTTRLYTAYNVGLQSSADLGATWSPIVPLEFGVSHHPRVGPDGTVYVAFWNFLDEIVLQRSFDGGATLEAPRTVAVRLDTWDPQDGSRFPGRFRVAPIAYLAIDPIDGTLYCVYFDTASVSGGQTDVALYITRSLDQGTTWSAPRAVHGNSGPAGDQFFPWLEVDSAGVLHLAFLDTRHAAQVDDQENGFFDVYYATSGDRGETWTETRVSPNSFSSGDATWPGFEQFLGDFISLTVDPDPSSGFVWIAYPATYDGDLDIYVQRLERPRRLIPKAMRPGGEAGS